MRTLLALRRAALPAVLLAAPLAAQSTVDARPCDQLANPARHPDARPRVQALAQGSGATAAFARGCLAMADARWSDATREFERAIDADGGRAAYHHWLGRAYGALAQRANVVRQASLARKTKAAFERAVQLDPEYLDARAGLVQYYLIAPGIMGGSEARARQQADEIRRRSPYLGAMAHGQIATRRKDWAGAERELGRLTEQFPDSGAPWTSLAVLRIQQKRWADAFRTVEEMQRALPASTMAQYLTGRIAAESGEQLERGDQALGRYLGAKPAPGEPSHAAARWRLGMIRERQGRREQARAEYQAALALDPELRGAKDALARLR